MDALFVSRCVGYDASSSFGISGAVLWKLECSCTMLYNFFLGYSSSLVCYIVLKVVINIGRLTSGSHTSDASMLPL